MRVSISSGPADEGFPWEQLIAIFPQILLILVLVTLLFAIGPRRVFGALGRIKKVGFLGLEIELAESLQSAGREKQVDVSDEDAERAARRLADAAPLLSCSRILWVDDEPWGNRREMKILRRMCVAIDLAHTTEDAERALQNGVYDLVISDMHRSGDPEAGRKIIPLATGAPLAPDVIFYVGKDLQVPESWAGTTRPDQLFTLIAQAIKRRRG